MKFTFKHADKVVGVFFLLSIFVIVISIVFILINQKTFTKKHYYKTEFSDRQGLKINSDINFNGFVIGKLVSFKLNDRDTVDVKIYIYDEYINRITYGSVLNRMSNPITGSTVFLLRNYNSNKIIPDNGFLPSLDTEEGKRLVEYGIIKTKGDNINNIINNVDQLLSSINNDKNADANSVARILVNSADIVENLRNDLLKVSEMLDNFKSLSYTMKEADGLVQRMVDPDGKYMFNSLQKSLTELASTMENLTSFTKFINNQQKEIELLMYDSKKTIDDTQKVLEGLKNNPLLKGGITNKKDSAPSTVNTREMDLK